jgi:hypothetical protein
MLRFRSNARCPQVDFFGRASAKLRVELPRGSLYAKVPAASLTETVAWVRNVVPALGRRDRRQQGKVTAR